MDQPRPIHFHDHPEFRPNLTPYQIFKRGAFGGTYWRPIYSRVCKQHFSGLHRQYNFKDIPEEHLTKPWDQYDTSINKYKVKVGTTLQFWEDKGWIKPWHPYGWVHWYCDFYYGKRGPDDERQIKRWQRLAGPRGRFKVWLKRLIAKKKTTWDDLSVSPKIRQTLLHWAVELTADDM